ncbi:MAG: BPL-N domain-containing protein [bacterium]
MNRTASRLGCLLLITILAFPLSTSATPPPASADVALLITRAGLDGVTAMEGFLNWKGLSYTQITSDEINEHALQDYFRVLVVPSGDFFAYVDLISFEGQENIRKLVEHGGGYIGIGGGAYYAADRVEYCGQLYNFPLDLFRGLAFGRIDRISPSVTMTRVSLDPDSALNQTTDSDPHVLYTGGPAFYPERTMPVETVATYDEFEGDRAIIAFELGSGRVLLLGPQLEYEEDSIRDGTSFYDSFTDQGSDWNLLGAYFDWVLGTALTPFQYPE